MVFVGTGDTCRGTVDSVDTSRGTVGGTKVVVMDEWCCNGWTMFFVGGIQFEKQEN